MLPNSKNRGFTIVELLIAMAIFGILIAIASGAIVQYLRVQSDQEAITSAQSKLRRVTELVSQELRSAVFGSIISSPYPSNSLGISFMLLDGGAGYPVNPHDSGSNNSFKAAATLTINSLAPDAATLGIADNDQLLMINGNGQALLFTVGNVTQISSRWSLNHPGCGNTIDYTTGSTLLFKVRSFGLRHDAASKELRATDGATAEQPLAYNITRFRIDYVYNDVPQATYTTSTNLDRLQVVISTEELSRGKAIERTYSSQIELPASALQMGGLTVCS
jgi:prepilin-type N-terminal cleavage/methylation domain-containing protein